MELRANAYGISERIDELITNLRELENAWEDGTTTVNIDRADFVTPLSLLPLVVYANNTGITITCSETNEDIIGYMNVIGFPDGTSHPASNGKYYSTRNYLPLMRLPNTENTILTDYEGNIISQASAIQDVTGLNYSLSHLTGELQTNVNEHSRADHYWMLAQYYQSMRKNTCEIVIADCGIGYKQSYHGTPYEVGNDRDAILNVLNGRSSKVSRARYPEMGDFAERGSGVRSIVNLFRNGYGGKVIFMSGDTIVYGKPGESLKIIPLKSYWHGSLTAINFNLKPMSYGEFLNYIDI